MKVLTLNVGCGNRTYDYYPDKIHKCINLDSRGLENVDVIADARELPFEDEKFEYVLASDILEHFPISETNNVLKEWLRVLKTNGIIEIRVPDLSKICNDYLKGVNDANKTSWLLYGGQDYPDNFHYVGFDRHSLKEILVKLGLKEVYNEQSGNNFVVKYKTDRG